VEGQVKVIRPREPESARSCRVEVEAELMFALACTHKAARHSSILNGAWTVS
jgi:hypothetical protein